MEQTPSIIHQLTFSLLTGDLLKREWRVVSATSGNFLIQVRRPDGRILRKKTVRLSDFYRIFFANDYAIVFYPDTVADPESVRNAVLREIETFLGEKEREIQRFRESFEKLKVAPYKNVQ